MRVEEGTIDSLVKEYAEGYAATIKRVHNEYHEVAPDFFYEVVRGGQPLGRGVLYYMRGGKVVGYSDVVKGIYFVRYSAMLDYEHPKSICIGEGGWSSYM